MKPAFASPDVQMVTFLLNGQEYCVDVMKVREIICMTPVTKTTGTSHYVEGMINLRGIIVPVISLRKRFGMSDTGYDVNTCIAIMDHAGELTGFIVDEVADVVRIRRDQIQPPVDGMEQEWIEGILHRDQMMVVVMNMEHLI